MKSNLLGKFYDTGATLIQQGDVGDCMFVLQEGEVAVLKEEDGR